MPNVNVSLEQTVADLEFFLKHFSSLKIQTEYSRVEKGGILADPLFMVFRE